jgi:hypothetical protein
MHNLETCTILELQSLELAQSWNWRKLGFGVILEQLQS